MFFEVRLSLTILAIWKEAKCWKALHSTSSVTSGPMSPTKMRKSFSGHSSRLESHLHTQDDKMFVHQL